MFNIKTVNKQGVRRVLHTLNNTALATSRIMVAILENHQQPDGSIKIPRVLWKYTGFKVIKSKTKSKKRKIKAKIKHKKQKIKVKKKIKKKTTKKKPKKKPRKRKK